MGEMSKTPEEIKIGLECCEKYLNGAPEEECCHVCNYANNCAELKLDAIAMIREMQGEKKRIETACLSATARAERLNKINRELTVKMKQLKEERDAAIDAVIKITRAQKECWKGK